MLTDDEGRFTWTAAVVGSNNAAGYQLAAGAPVLAVGGFNGTDPSPTTAQFVRDVEDGRIHYFIEGRPLMGRADPSSVSADITEWVAERFPAIAVDGTVLYDLTMPQISQPAHSPSQR